MVTFVFDETGIEITGANFGTFKLMLISLLVVRLRHSFFLCLNFSSTELGFCLDPFLLLDHYSRLMYLTVTLVLPTSVTPVTKLGCNSLFGGVRIVLVFVREILQKDRNRYLHILQQREHPRGLVRGIVLL